MIFKKLKKNNMFRFIDLKISNIIERQPINGPILTDITAVDGMIPIGREQNKLIINEYNTGKITIAIDAIINKINIFNISLFIFFFFIVFILFYKLLSYCISPNNLLEYNKKKIILPIILLYLLILMVFILLLYFIFYPVLQLMHISIQYLLLILAINFITFYLLIITQLKKLNIKKIKIKLQKPLALNITRTESALQQLACQWLSFYNFIFSLFMLILLYLYCFLFSINFKIFEQNIDIKTMILIYLFIKFFTFYQNYFILLKIRNNLNNYNFAVTNFVRNVNDYFFLHVSRVYKRKIVHAITVFLQTNYFLFNISIVRVILNKIYLKNYSTLFFKMNIFFNDEIVDEVFKNPKLLFF